MHCTPGGAVERLLAVLAELRAVEVVGLAELVHEPDDFVRVANDVRGELRRDHEVDRAALHLVEVEQAPDERLRDDRARRIPLERHGHELGLVPARAELRDEVLDQELGAAAGERDLRMADEDSQRCATSA